MLLILYVHLALPSCLQFYYNISIVYLSSSLNALLELYFLSLKCKTRSCPLSVIFSLVKLSTSFTSNAMDLSTSISQVEEEPTVGGTFVEEEPTVGGTFVEEEPTVGGTSVEQEPEPVTTTTPPPPTPSPSPVPEPIGGGAEDGTVSAEEVSRPEGCPAGTFLKEFDGTCMECDANCVEGGCVDNEGCTACRPETNTFRTRPDPEWPFTCESCTISQCTKCVDGVYDAWPMRCEECAEGYAPSRDGSTCELI